MKKKALVLAVCLAVSAPVISVVKALPSDVVGLNLGNIKTSSYVGQKFEGEIPILFSNQKEAEQLSVRLAPKSVFQKIGAERSAFLETLSFQVTTRNNKPVIAIHSSNAVEMPFLNFIIEVSGSQGTVFQDYTVLVDPPGYQPVSQSNTPDLAPSFKPSVKVKKESRLTLNKTNSVRYKVSSGDTLYKIAKALKQSQMSLKRMIDVIHNNNPKAFVNNDINKIKRGAYIRIPSANKIKKFKFSLANKSVKPVTKVESSNVKGSSKAKSVEYTVKKGDSLFRITKSFGRKDISFTKRMAMIHRANPHAFSRNKINELFAGATLVIPYLQGANEKSSKRTDVKASVDLRNARAETAAQLIANKADDGAEFLASGVESLLNALPVAIANSKTVEKSSNTKTQENSTVIQSLEKRVRELRDSLSESKRQLVDLEEMLATKDVELKKKNSKISALKIDIQDLESELFTDTSAAVKPKVTVESPIVEPAIPKVLAHQKELPKKVVTSQSQVSESNEIDFSSLAPKALLDKIETGKSSPKLVNLLRDMPLGTVSAGFLATLLALGLISYRRRLYSYVRVTPQDQFSDVDNPIEGKEQLIIDSALEEVKGTGVEKQLSDISTAKIDETGSGEFTEATLEECDELISELSHELKNDNLNLTDNEDKWGEVEKICDTFIDKMNDDKVSELLADLDSSEPEISFENMVDELIDNLDEESKENDFSSSGELKKLKLKLDLEKRTEPSELSSNYREIMGMGSKQ